MNIWTVWLFLYRPSLLCDIDERLDIDETVLFLPKTLLPIKFVGFCSSSHELFNLRVASFGFIYIVNFSHVKAIVLHFLRNMKSI